MKTKFSWNRRGSYYSKEEWLEEFLHGKGALYNGSESDDSDNDGDNHNENNDQQQLPEGFANSCYKIVSPILPPELISNFAVCKGCSCYCSGPLLLAVNLSHGFVGLELHISKSNHSFY